MKEIIDIQKKVSRFIEISNESAADDVDHLARLLISNGITETEAEALIAFVPMGFAHELLSGAGVRLPESFLIRDFETGASARGMLNDEPIFTASKTLARLMLEDPITRPRAIGVAEQSAECAVVRELCPDGRDIDDCVLTETVLARLPIEHLRKPSGGSKWRFWKRG
ncbi:MAG TPA: hypothetical protein VGE67_09820 [Haloferula sp.]